MYVSHERDSFVNFSAFQQSRWSIGSGLRACDGAAVSPNEPPGIDHGAKSNRAWEVSCGNVVVVLPHVHGVQHNSAWTGWTIF